MEPATENQLEMSWRKISGFAYEVSADGQIRRINSRLKTKTYLRQGTTKSSGYKIAGLSKEAKVYWFTVHRLVAKAFVANPENKPEVNHLNGDKSDNRSVNLEWVTPKENHRHASENGLKASGDRNGSRTHPERRRRGETVPSAKLSSNNVVAIRRMNSDGFSVLSIATRFNVNKTTVQSILNRKTWKHIYGPANSN